MEFEKLTAQVRAGRKKGTARKLRRNGMIPAVCYGPEAAPVALSVDPKELSEALSGPLGRNTVIQLTVQGDGAGDSRLVMLQDYQYHPIERSVLHADFLQIAPDREVAIQVPFILEGRSIGEQAGGVVMQVYRHLPVRCKPTAIPTDIRLEISEMDMGDLRKASDLELPDDVVLEIEQNLTLVSISAPTVVEEPEEEEGEGEGEEGEGEGEEGEEAPEESGEQ